VWEIYDRLIADIPDELTVEEYICGMTWTAGVSSAGSVGLAMTTPVQTLPAAEEKIVGMKLKKAAELVKSWNFVEAGVGMAAINAWYNSPGRLEMLQTRQGDTRFCTFDIPYEGKNICMVGALRYPKGMFDSAASLVVMERNLVPGTYPDSSCEYYIPKADLVLITGSAFINKTMPRLLQLGEDADVIITGPSAPMTETLL